MHLGVIFLIDWRWIGPSFVCWVSAYGILIHYPEDPSSVPKRFSKRKTTTTHPCHDKSEVFLGDMAQVQKKVAMTKLLNPKPNITHDFPFIELLWWLTYLGFICPTCCTRNYSYGGSSSPASGAPCMWFTCLNKYITNSELFYQPVQVLESKNNPHLN